MRASGSVAKIAALLFLTVSAASAGSNLTAEECLSIERISSVRRSPKKVSVIENNPAYLHCAVGSGAEISDFMVAWTRLRDDALLTAGKHAFTSDARFQISEKKRARDWVLLIRRVQPSDAGCYLCEINTEPANTLVPVYLSVIPIQEIPKRHYFSGTRSAHAVRNSNLVARMEGDAVLLNCTVAAGHTVAAPSRAVESGDVLWTKDNVPIELDLDDPKYTTFASVSPAGSVVHVLRIAGASPADDGVYACEGESLARSAQMVQVNAVAGSGGGGALPSDFTLFSSNGLSQRSANLYLPFTFVVFAISLNSIISQYY